MKKCNSCRIEKEETQFFKDVKRSDGLKSKCKECLKRPKEYYRKYREAQESSTRQKEKPAGTQNEVKESVQESPCESQEYPTQKERAKVYIPFLNEYR